MASRCTLSGWILAKRPLVRELPLSQISATFPINGTTMPQGDYYKRLLDNEFRDWKLRVHGLVDRPLALTLAQLQSLLPGAHPDHDA